MSGETCKHCGTQLEWHLFVWCDPSIADDEDDIHCNGFNGQIHQPAVRLSEQADQ